MRVRSLAPAAAAAGLLALAGCATSGVVARGPAPTGGAWHVASSEGFEVWTEAGAAVAAEVALDLERLQATLEAAYPLARPAQRPRVRVLLLPGPVELEELAGPGVSGFFTRLTDPPTIVADLRRARADRSVLAHELGHHHVERWLVQPPRWLDEGLAEHLETIGAPGAAPGTVGLAPRWARGWRPEQGFVRRLLAWDGRVDPARPRREPSEAWALVSFLASEEPERLEAFLRALERGAPAAAAFTATFPEWSGGELLGAYRLELRVRAFLAAGRHRTRTFRVAAREEAGVRVRAAPAADVRLLRLELPRRRRQPLEAVRSEVAAALREDPGHPEALRWQAQLDGLAPLPLAERAVEASPRDWRSWRFLATALPPGGEGGAREEALRWAVALEPGRPELLRALAQHLADEGRPAEAAPLARLAAELRPWDPGAVTTYAAAALELAACPVAPAPASRAAALRAEPALDAERQVLAVRLRALEQRCELDALAAAAFGPAGVGVGAP